MTKDLETFELQTAMEKYWGYIRGKHKPFDITDLNFMWHFHGESMKDSEELLFSIWNMNAKNAAITICINYLARKLECPECHKRYYYMPEKYGINLVCRSMSCSFYLVPLQPSTLFRICEKNQKNYQEYLDNLSKS